MSLALATVLEGDFDIIHAHLTGHRRGYRCMHLRQTRQHERKRTLRYLHAMYAAVHPAQHIEGLISGPGVFWHYRLIKTAASRTQLNVIAERAPAHEKARMAERFLREILERVKEEHAGNTYHPRRIAGQFYLRRSLSGMPDTHPLCLDAVRQQVLDSSFVAQLQAWNLQLLRP